MKIKLLIALLVGVVSLTYAQTSKNLQFYNTYNTTNVLTTDTVTNTGTAYVRVRKAGGHSNTTTITCAVLEISGTTAGTVTLEGSIDPNANTAGAGTGFKAIPTIDTQTSITTASPADQATVQYFTWRINGSPLSLVSGQVCWSGNDGSDHRMLSNGSLV